LLLLGAVGCAQSPTPEVTTTQAATICGVGPTVQGIDVSYYQGSIDWSAVAGAGIKFASIRAYDGTTFEDPNFETYWADSRAAGVVHGAYQFFRPTQDPIAQADLLLAKIGGQLAPDDLPPVLDVEVSDGASAAQVAAGIHTWLDHVAAAIGRRPIIYTGFYFWRDSVGGADDTASPLWHAQYTSAACPTIADPWTDWAIWQYTSTGSIPGISGNVDLDRFNGDAAALQAFLGPSGSCGDGTCTANESKTSCPEDCGPCGEITDSGATIVDDSGACFTPGGPQATMRHVTDAGEDGELYWTHATADTVEANFGQWNLFFDAAGPYQLEVSTSAKYAQSKRAAYVVHTMAGDSTVMVDQSAVDGWQSLGSFQFAAGGHQWVHLGDNTGEPSANNVQLVFDAVRVTPVDGTGSNTGSNTGSDAKTGDRTPTAHTGCNAGGDGVSWSLWFFAFCAALRWRSASRRH
jgi:GH25 family lysozyme M1 (1,4-beta-N-acetylmuramidase)